MQFEDKEAKLKELNEEALLADGFEGALIGYVEVQGKTLALYDRWKCIDILIKRDKMETQDAIEYLEFNTIQAFAGEGTPAFATMWEDA